MEYDKPTVTYISASHLQDAHKIMQKKAKRDSTILPHAGNIDNLHNAHTSSSANQPFLNQFAVPENPIRTRPTTMQTANVHTQTDGSADVNANLNGTLETPARLARSSGNAGRSKKTNSKPRCRRCGKEWSTPAWKNYHKNNIPNDTDSSSRIQNRFLRHGEGNNVWGHCTVDESNIEIGFPCYEGKMPRRKKTR